MMIRKIFNLFKRKNYFQRKLKEIKHYPNDVYYEIDNFSNKLKRKTKLTESDIKQAYESGIEWNIPRYVIYPVKRCHDRWKWLLEVKTPNMSKSHGYINVKSDPPPKNWHYKPSGTRTEILPDSQTQQHILKLIDVKQ